MTTKRIRGEVGSTLVESLVAICLFGLCSSAVSNLMVQHIRHQSTNRATTAAIALAEQELEHLSALAYADVGSRATAIAIDNLTYTVTTTVTRDTPAANMKLVATEVGWAQPDGSHTYRVNAIYTDIQ